jgi:hypothetical protein
MMGGMDSDWRILKNDFLRPSFYADAIYDEGRIYAVTEPRGDVLVWQPMEYGKFVFYLIYNNFAPFVFMPSNTVNCFLD